MKMAMEVEYRQMHCTQCGVLYFFPEKWCDQARVEGKSWHCPNGHSQWFGESAHDQVIRERDRLKQRAAQLEDEARAERERAEKAIAATKRLKKRTAAGSCPACKRTFSNMATHIRKMHPQFHCEATGQKPALKVVS